MIDRVTETLTHWRRVPFSWDGEDCLMSLANYLLPILQWDLGEPFRGRYHTEQEASALIEAAGGAVAVFDRTGFAHTDTPERGDIVFLDMGGRVTGALCTHGRVYPPGSAYKPVGAPACPRGVFYAAARLRRGVAELDLSMVPVLTAWSVPKCLPL